MIRDGVNRMKGQERKSPVVVIGTICPRWLVMQFTRNKKSVRVTNAVFLKERPLNVKRFYRNMRSIVMKKLYVL